MRISRAPDKIPRAAFALAFIALLASGCKPATLPDPSSPGAQLYVSRCSSCHAPYDPHELTAEMWDTQVTMMEVKMQSAGMPPLSPDDRAAIVDYLKRNAVAE